MKITVFYFYFGVYDYCNRELKNILNPIFFSKIRMIHTWFIFF